MPDSEPFKTVPRIPEPPLGGFDTNADKESALLASGNYEEEAKKNHHNRSELIKDNLHYASIGVIWLIVAALAVFGISFVIHLATPWGWLPDKQLHDIQNILFSGLLAGVLSSHFRQYL